MPFAPTQLPSGRWRGGYRHPVTKRQVRQTFDFEWEAESWAVTEEGRARAGLADPEPVPAAAPAEPVWLGPTVRDYGKAYIDRRAGSLARATRNKYSAFLDGLCRDYGKRPTIGSRHMGTLRRSEVEQWITDAVDAGVGRPSINGQLSLLRRLFLDLVAEGGAKIEVNPTNGIRKLRENQSKDRLLSVDEELALLAAAPDELQIPAMLALDCGLRWQEVYALRVGSLSAGPTSDNDYVLVSAVVERGSRTLRHYPKSDRSRRTVPVSLRLVEPLAELVHGRGEDELLFPNHAGQRFDYSNFRNQVWGPTMHAIGLAEKVQFPTSRVRKYGPEKGQPYTETRYRPEFGFHALRHTYGSRLAAKGVPRHEIARLMGHSDERTTARYIHVGDEGALLARVRDAQAS